jgi:ABC-type dipeptide/oligopeptide/nickel transport system permease subunit
VSEAVVAAPALSAPVPRSPWRLALRRVLRDRAGMVGVVTAIVVALAVLVGAPIAAALVGHGPNDLNFNAGRPLRPHPVGAWTWVPGQAAYMPHRSLFVLGADGQTGRDMFLRILYGGQTTLEIALLASFLGVGIGTLLGLLSGYLAGRVGALILWLTEVVMTFPFLLLCIAIWTSGASRWQHYQLFGLFGPGILLLAALIGGFAWFYPMRMTRVLVLSLREREFIEAARMIGASELRIMRRHVLPHLAGPLLAYGVVAIANAMLLEAGLAWLGLAVPTPEPSWGVTLTQVPVTLLVQGANRVGEPSVWIELIPVVALLVTIVALNLAAEALRRALEPSA